MFRQADQGGNRDGSLSPAEFQEALRLHDAAREAESGSREAQDDGADGEAERPSSRQLMLVAIAGGIPFVGFG